MSREPKIELVLQALREADGPLSANELWGRLQSTGIGIATIYRALKAGVGQGSLRVLDLPGGSTRYDPVDLAHHHHFICSDCDRVYDIEGCVGGLEKILPPRFAMTGHEVLLFGTCEACQEVA